MVKQILGKRASKKVTVEEYWDTKKRTRNRLTESENLNQKAIHLDLSSRHRFTKDHQKKKNLDVNIIHKIQQIQVLPHSHEDDEIGSFWFDELEYTKNITKYADFLAFYDDIQPYSQSLSIILHNLNIIVEKLLTHLAKARREVKIIILGILPSLIRDTQQYLYKPFCEKLLLPLVEMIVITDMELLEKVYNVLAFALKYLFEQISQDPTQFYYIYFQKLFSHHNKHIRQFSSESFSYVLKKVKSPERKLLFNLILDSMVNPQKILSNTQENSMEIEEENKEKIEEKLKLAITSLGHLVFTSLRGMGYFLNQKAIEIFKSFFQMLLSYSQKNESFQQLPLDRQQKGLQNACQVLEMVMSLISKKIASRELEDKLVFNFNDIVTSFTNIFVNFHDKNLQNTDNIHEIIYNSLTKILVQIIENENALKLDEISTPNLINLTNKILIFSEKTSQKSSKITQNLQINLSQLCGVFLRNLYQKDFFKKEQEEGKYDLSNIQSFILNSADSKDEFGSLTLDQAYHFIYRLVKSHNKTDLDKGLIVRTQQYLQECYNLPQELLNYVFIVVVNQLPNLEKCEENLQIYNILYQLSVAQNYSSQYQEKKKLQLKKHEEIVAKVYTESFEKTLDSFFEKQSFQSFLKSLSLLKFYALVEFSNETQEKFQEILQKLRQILNEKLQKDSELDENLKKSFLDLENKEGFYQIPIEIQKQYLESPFNSILSQNFDDLLIILKGEITLLLQSSSQQQQEIEKELYMLPKLTACQNPVYLKSLHAFLEKNLQKSEKLSIQKYLPAFECLQNNLFNKFSQIRLHSLEILQFFDFSDSKIDQEVNKINETLQKDNDRTEPLQLTLQDLMTQILNNLLEIETTVASLQFERAIKLAMERTRHLLLKQKLEFTPFQFLQILSNYFSGYAFVRFQLLWEPIKNFLSYLLTLSTQKSNKNNNNNKNVIYEQFCGHLKFYNWLALQDKPELRSQLFEKEKESIVIHQKELQICPKMHQNSLEFSEIFDDDHYLEMDSLDELIVLDTMFGALIGSKQTVSAQRLHIQLFFQQFIDTEHTKKNSLKENFRSLEQNEEDLLSTLKTINCEKSDAAQKAKKKSYYKKLELFLKLFYNIQGQKGLDKDYFFTYFMDFLKKDNEKIQLLALDNLTKYSIDGINLYKETITRLIKQDTFRSEIVTFNSDNETIHPEHRKHLLPIMISVLYPKLFSKRGLKYKTNIEVKKNIIFAMFSGFQEQELLYFIDLLLDDFSIPQELIKYNLAENQHFSDNLIQKIAKVPLQRLQGYLINLKNIFDKIGILLKPFLPQIFNTVLGILQLCQASKTAIKSLPSSTEENDDDKNTNNTSKISIVHKLVKETNKVGFQRIAELFRKFDDFINIEACVFSFLSIFEQKILNLQSECVKSPSGVFKVLANFAEIDRYQTYLTETQTNLFNSDNLKQNSLLSQIIHIYKSKNLAPEVARKTNKILNDLLFPEEAQPDDEAMHIEEDLLKHEQKQKELEAEKQQKKDNQSKIIQELGINLLENLVIYLQNAFQTTQVKHGKTVSQSLLLVQNLLPFYCSIIQDENYLRTEEEITIINSALEYFIKLFDSLRSKKIYVSLSTTQDNLRHNHQFIDSQTKEKQYDKIKKEKDLFFTILQIIEQAIQISTNADKFYEFVVTQLPYLTDLKFRSKIVQIIAKLKPSFISEEVVALLQEMNTEDRGVDRGLDYETIIPCYYKFNSEIIQNSQNYKDLELILMNYMSHIAEDELSLKIAIESGFKAFFLKIQENYEVLIQEEQNLKVVRQFLFTRFLPFLQDGFKKSVNKESVMKVYVKLLDHYVFIFSQLKKLDDEYQFESPKFFTEKSKHESAVTFLSLQILQNKTDSHQDFFDNIFDIQLPKRIKAMLILQKHYEKLTEHSDNLVKFLIPLFDFLIFTKCQEISSSNRISFTDTARSHFKSLLQVSIELYAQGVPKLSWSNLKIVLKKLMVYLQKKDDKTVVKLMGEIIKKLDLGELQEDIITKVNREMNNSKNQISEQGIMKKFVRFSSKKDQKKYNPEKEDVQTDKNSHFRNENHIDEFKGTEVLQEENLEIVEQKLFKQIEKNQLLLQKQQQVKNEYLKSKGQLPTETEQKPTEEEEDNETELKKQQELKSLRARQNFLKITLFIPLKSLLFAKYSVFKLEKKNEKVQTHIATALTNLCSKFHEDDFRLEFPKIIGKLAKTMKDKRTEVRDQTRKVLCEIIKITGPYFLHFVVKELKYYLNQGWEGHILNFTIYQLINHLDQNKIENGQIDYCLSDLLQALIPEIFGRLEEEKNLDIGKRIPELKNNKAFECIHLLAKMINFPDSILNFLGFVKDELQDNLHNAKSIPKFEELFRNSQLGFEKNPSVSLDSLLLVSISLIKDSVQLIEHSRKKDHMLDTTQKLDDSLKPKEMLKFNKDKTFSILDVTAQNKSIFKEVTKMKRQSMFKVGAHLSNFGLKLVLLGIKKKIFTQKLMKEQPETCIQFEELLKLIIQCLDTTDNTMLQNALKVLKEVLIWPLRFIKRHKKSIINASIDVIQKLTVTDQDLIQDTFKLVQIVISHFTVDQFKPTQISGLLEYIKQFTEQSDFLTEPLNTLKLLIDKKFVHLEVYNLLDLVKTKMIQCYNRPLQTICKNIFLSFLINYPLSDKLLQNYINFLIKNTEYTDPTGRALVYEVLKTFLEKFPEQVTQYFGEILFLALLVNQSKEQVESIQTQIKEMLKITLQQLNKQKQLALLNNCFTWLQSDSGNTKLGIVTAAFQGMKLFIEIGEIYQSEKFEEGFENIVIPRIKSLFTLIESSLLAYKNQMAQIKQVKAKITDEQKQKLNELTYQTDKTLENLNSVFIAGIQFLHSLLQKNRSFIETLLIQQIEGPSEQEEQQSENESESEQENEEDKEEGNEKQTLLCKLFSFLRHPSQVVQNELLSLLNTLFEKSYPLLKENFLEKKSQISKNLLPQSLKSLYIYKIRNNTVIEETQSQHKLLSHALSLFKDSSSSDLIELTLFNLKKFTQKALAKTEQNLPILENIIDFYKQITDEKDEDEQGDFFAEFLKDEKYLEHILVPIMKIKNQEEQLQKVKQTKILEKCEIVIENIKRQTDLNYFFQVYSNLKVKLHNVNAEKKVQKKQMAVVDPVKAAQLRKQKNQQRYKSKKNVFKNKIKGAVPTKYIKPNN